jgi:hypothetical protein
VLKVCQPALERQKPPPTDAIDRVRRSVALLEEYIATSLKTDPWQYLEYYCDGCLLRLRWNTPDWEGRQLAFMEQDYDEHMREIESIERGRRGPARSWPPPG